MKQVTISQNEPILKAIEPNEDIYDIHYYSVKSRNKTKPRIQYQMTPTIDDINKIHIKTNSNYINITTTIPRSRNINHKYSLSYSECIPPKKYYSKFQHFKTLNNNRYNDVNYYYIPGLSYHDYLSELNTNIESNVEKQKDEFQQTQKFNDTFDEQLYNKLMFFDKLANNISKEHIYSSSEYIVNKINKKENIEKPECIIHNIFLTLVLKNIYKKIEIRRILDNKVVSIDYIYSLLQNEIEKMRGAIKKSIKLVKNDKAGKGNNKINLGLGIRKYLNTDFISYIHFTKNSHIRNISMNNNSETRYTDILNGNDEYSMKYNNSGIIYENDEKYIHSKYNYKFRKYDESDKGDYSEFVDFNNDFIDYNSPYHKMVKNKSGFIIPNILQKGIFVKNKNIDLIDSKTGKSIFKEDGTFNITFYDKKGNKIKNPDINDNSIEYYDKKGNLINIKKIPKIKFYDKEGNIIENPNLDNSNIKYYDENGKVINTQSTIQIQLYDKKGRPISKIDNSNTIQYYDEKGNPIQIPKKKVQKEIKVPKGYKFISNDEGQKIIIPEGYKYISNNEGEKILVDEKGNKVNENDFIVKIESESESEIEVEGINEKGEKIIIKVNKNEVKNKMKKKKKKKKIKKIRKNENGDIEEYSVSENDESENDESEYDESENEEIEIVNEKGEKIKVKINPNNLKKKKKKKKIKYKIKNEKGEEISVSEEIDESNEKNESEYEEEEEDEEEKEEEVEEEIEIIDNNGNKIKKKVKKIIKKKVPKKKNNKDDKNKNKKSNKNNENIINEIENNGNKNYENRNNENTNNDNRNNENIEKEKNEKKKHSKNKKKHNKNKVRIDETESNNEKSNEKNNYISQETNNKTLDYNNYNNNESNDDSIKPNKRFTQNNNNNEDYIESEEDEDNEIKKILQRTKYDKDNEEQNKKIEEYNNKIKQHKKEIEEYLNNKQRANISFPKKQKERVDPLKLRKLIEEVRNNQLGNKSTDEDIYNKISKESELYKEWIKIGNNYIFEEEKPKYNRINEDKNYSLVGKGEFIMYKGKNYFENKKEESNESKPLPQEFVNWLKAEIKKLDNSYSLKKKDRSSVNSIDNVTLQLSETISGSNTKRNNNQVKVPKKQIPKKKLNQKKLKVLNYFEEEDKDKLPTPISRSESSDSIKSINNTQSLKYLFEQIQKLKNLPPDEYTKKVNNLLDYQLDNTQVMLHRKHADRINKFIENLEYYRKSRINFQKILSDKLSYLPPIIIKKLNDDDNKKTKRFFLSVEKTKGSENILIPRNKTKNIIENIKI